jgi:hypothetical protein
MYVHRSVVYTTFVVNTVFTVHISALSGHIEACNLSVSEHHGFVTH